jgi:hypothetical protein
VQSDEVRCRICNEVKKRGKLLVLKFDELQKPCKLLQSNICMFTVVVDQYYMSTTSQHVKNKWWYATFH